MAISYIKQTDEGFYEIVGTTNIGRPMKIEVSLGESRKSYVSVEPHPGASFEEPFAEIELQHVIAEYEAIERRIASIFEMTPVGAADEEILASIASVVSKQKMAASDIEDLTLIEHSMGM